MILRKKKMPILNVQMRKQHAKKLPLRLKLSKMLAANQKTLCAQKMLSLPL